MYFEDLYWKNHNLDVSFGLTLNNYFYLIMEMNFMSINI